MIQRLTDNAELILEERYYREGENWPKLCQRVAHAVAQAEKPKDRERYETEFAEMINSLDLIPNSPCLRNAGNERQMLSACFVLGIEDSRESIFGTLANAAEIQAYGGGTGFDWSALRPEGSPVKGTGGTASGPISFMQGYNSFLGWIISQGGLRRGANMGSLLCTHPDIFKFISCKEKDGELAHFNISVAITDDFMKKLKRTLSGKKQWISRLLIM